MPGRSRSVHVRAVSSLALDGSSRPSANVASGDGAGVDDAGATVVGILVLDWGPKDEAVAIAAADRGIVVFEWAASSAVRCCDNDAAINVGFDDDGNYFDSIDSDFDSWAGWWCCCCCSPKLWAAIDSASFGDDDASSTDCRTLCWDRFPDFRRPDSCLSAGWFARDCDGARPMIDCPSCQSCGATTTTDRNDSEGRLRSVEVHVSRLFAAYHLTIHHWWIHPPVAHHVPSIRWHTRAASTRRVRLLASDIVQ